MGWNMLYKKKCIIILSITLISPLIISACNTSSSLQRTEDVSSQIESTENNNTSTDIDYSLPEQEKDRIIITVEEMDEETFIEQLDTDILTTVAEKLQEVTDEIGRKQAADPESVLRGDWVTDYSNSEQYHYVINQGVKAVKPMYYILYKSNQAGLYEYIISSAIYDIIGYDFSNDKGYQWATAFEFREKYNACVKESISQFYSILDDTSINETDKIDKIANLGIFVIAPLLNELDYKNSELDENIIYTILGEILNTSFNNDVSEDINTWRKANEKYYRDIIEILPLS
jgi:hypothetical protein